MDKTLVKNAHIRLADSANELFAAQNTLAAIISGIACAKGLVDTLEDEAVKAEAKKQVAELEIERIKAQSHVDMLTAITNNTKGLIHNFELVKPKKDHSTAADIAKVAIPAAATIAGAIVGYLGVRALVNYEKDEIIRPKNAATLAVRNAS